MLAHEHLQQQLLDDRRRELAALDARRQAHVPRARREAPYVVQSVKAVWPLFTHRIFGIPAPARPASGC
jgi:hypothetical protein